MDSFFIFILFFSFMFVLLFSIILIFSNPKLAIRSYFYKFGLFFIFLGIILILDFGTFILLNNAGFGSADESEGTADGFVIDSFHVQLDVDKNSSIQVQEKIGVNFTESGHHGIYRFIPLWLEYTDKDNNINSRRAKIKNLSSEEEYSIESINGKEKIRIGNVDKTLPTGLHNYYISYIYDMGTDPYDGFDEFIFHLYGDYWGTPINNASLEINLPDEIDSNTPIHFFSDKYRKNDITNHVNYQIIDKKIIAEVDSDYNLDSALTIDIELPDGYFINGTSPYGIKSLLLCIMVVIISFITIILWLIFGKDNSKKNVEEEFYPPEGMDAAQVGYIYKNDGGKKLAIATIIELASKGYIKIIDSNDGGDPVIQKVVGSDINKSIERKIKVIKLQEYKRPVFDTNYYSSNLMEKMFPKNSSNTDYIITDDFRDFETYSPYLINNGYIQIIYDTLQKYTPEAQQKIKNTLLEKEEKHLDGITSNERIVYDALFESGEDETVLSKNNSFYLVFTKLSNNLHSEQKYLYDLKSDIINFVSSILFVFSVFGLGFAYCFIKDLNPTYRFLYYIAFVCLFISLIFSIFMDRKSDYGEKILAKVKGFKKHIENVDKDILNEYVSKNPSYYYDILPYAYVLGVTKTWIEKFENIPVPLHDMGNYPYNNVDHFDSLSNSVSSPSGSSSSGGGCSSCGGGCSSCGGGGSW